MIFFSVATLQQYLKRKTPRNTSYEQTILHSGASVVQEWVLKHTTPKCSMVLTIFINTVFIDSLLKTKGLESLKYFNTGSLSDTSLKAILELPIIFYQNFKGSMQSTLSK